MCVMNMTNPTLTYMYLPGIAPSFYSSAILCLIIYQESMEYNCVWCIIGTQTNVVCLAIVSVYVESHQQSSEPTQ